ncbi:Orotate phosphoribosyltransferase [Alkalibacterium sp. AK22]|nr:Orotate phosphoribosyltransferase [Alkalibacterium sp. AK22]
MITEPRNIPEELLRIGAVTVSPNKPFTWSSGLKSPIYCDNRLTMSFPEVRSQIIDGFVDLIHTHYPSVEVIAGTSTAGIPHAAWIAERMGLPMIYIRSEAKAHGKGRRIEGRFDKGAKMVVIEDLISTGQSVIDAVNAVTAEGADVLGVAAIFTYELELGEQAFRDLAIRFQTITDYSSLIEAAVENRLVDETDRARLEAWKKSPSNWS